MKLLAEFCKNFSRILSAGCGPYEAQVIKATHALDASTLAGHYLTWLGWQGEFRQGDVADMPYLSNSFDVAVCSEVIEHLPDEDMVVRTFAELNQISKNWIVTTPCNPLGPKNTEPTHKRAFTLTQLQEHVKMFDAKIFIDAIYFYVVKDGSGSFARISDKYAVKPISA